MNPLRHLPVMALAIGLFGAIQAAGAEAAATGPHWAYIPLKSVAPPTATAAAAGSNPVDRFIRATLDSRNLHPSPEADRRTLLRRVTFDLTGLPPTPDELEAFLADRRPDAYERVVDRLLASPRHGERWARHWMDVIHFAETHGHDQDRIRTNAWPYRDYLVDSFNSDKPYPRFVAEQVAGDTLWPDDPRATVAMGFISAGPWDESSLRDIREDTLDRQIGRYLDRDDMIATVMQTFTSTTVQCARCHDHKFDPVSQADYYSLQAVFAGVDRANRYYDPEPTLHRRRQFLLRERNRLEGDAPAILAQLDSPEAAAEVADWERRWREHRVEWRTLAPAGQSSTEGATLVRQDDGSILSKGKLPEKDTVTVVADVRGLPITAIRLEVLPDASLPKNGPGRNENGNLHLSEFGLWAAPADHGEFQRVALDATAADYNQDGWGIGRAIDGDSKTAWGIYPAVGQAHEAVFRLRTPLPAANGVTLMVGLQQLHGGGHLIGRFRISITSSKDPLLFRDLPQEIVRILSTKPDSRTISERRSLARHRSRERIDAQLAALPAASLVYAAAHDFVPDGSLVPSRAPRPIRVLKRGEITKPAEPAGPGTLGCIVGLPSRFPASESAPEGERRAALARWLTDHENPLTWRSIVNRVWHHHFGRGLVDTPNDFGRMGGVPSHPELLDWLAVWFRDDAQGSLKALHRLIVTSATYRQVSNPDMAAESPGVAAAAVDQDNRLLWRMNRTRLDAEEIRDAALAASGRLDLRMGGPGDRQFDLRPGIHVTPLVDYTRFDPDSAEGARRGTYRFLFRTLPDPFMDALDCPAGDQLTPVRSASVTVQQALALWNNVFIARQSEHLARRLEAESNLEANRLSRACELLLGRPPTAPERAQFAAYVRRHGLANFCRLLFNANEFVFVN